FFLSRDVKRGGRGTRYCDLVLVDLDPDDGIVVLVENKLFTRNRPGQLAEYLAAAESKFDRVPTRDYVYLTLKGDAPVSYAGLDGTAEQRWVQLGWTTHLLPEVFRPLTAENPGARELGELCEVLTWMASLGDPL